MVSWRWQIGCGIWYAARSHCWSTALNFSYRLTGAVPYQITHQDSATPMWSQAPMSLQWCHNECIGISNHQHLDCLLSRFFRHRSKKTSKLCVTGLYEGNSPVTGEFPAQRASNAENDDVNMVMITVTYHEQQGVSTYCQFEYFSTACSGSQQWK